MIKLNEISKVGFGSYRVSLETEEHQKALLLALGSGCNLVDTASQYADGQSEKLIGHVMLGLKPELLFIITKAGYVKKNDFEHLHKSIYGEAVAISDDYVYALHPDFLDQQMQQSLQRLNRRYLDCFMLHNPEHLFKDSKYKGADEAFYGTIQKAFEFLERKVSEGIVRYYGMSSNVFPGAEGNISLEKTLGLARQVSRDNHFKMIQFPFNIFENKAISGKNHEQKSLLDIAKENGIITVGNRPLNANVNNGSVRLANYATVADERKFTASMQRITELVQDELKKQGRKENLYDFQAFANLETKIRQFGNHQALQNFFQRQFYPFLQTLYEDTIPAQALDAAREFEGSVSTKTLENINRVASSYKDHLANSGVINKDDIRPLQVILVEQYLRQGIDHVLVGMRKEKYVNEFSPLFLNS